MTVLVTRPKGQAAGLAEPLEALGATVVSLPAIAIEAPLDPEPLEEALLNAERYDWIVVTSVNGVQALNVSAELLGIREKIAGRRLAAVGPSTAERLRESFREPDAIPEEAIGERIADALGDVRGKLILLARADIARKDLPNRLRELGAEVDDLVAYRIVRPVDDSLLPETPPDWIALTSSSGAVGTHEALMARGKGDWMRRSRLACIGPLTAATVSEQGFEVATMAKEHTIPGLVEAIVSGSLPVSGGGGQGGGSDGEFSTIVRSSSLGAETADGRSSVIATTPSTWETTPADFGATALSSPPSADPPTVPPAVRDECLAMDGKQDPRRQGEPS